MKYIPQNKLASYRKNNQPSRCPILDILTDDWVVDHDHQTGMIRGVISRQANSLLGKIENCYLKMCRGDKEFLPLTLLSLSTYLDTEQTDILHPVGAKQLANRFLRKKKEEQEEILLELNIKKSVIKSCNNAKDRTNLYSSSYSYRSCEDILKAVKPLLKENNVALIISDEVESVYDRVYVVATASLYGSEGNLIASSKGYAKESETRKGMDDSQITGSTSSYARKYALNGLFCIDDAKDADATNTHGSDKPKPVQAKYKVLATDII
jgi:hypothetical protein